jgi:hypothetical protein
MNAKRAKNETSSSVDIEAAVRRAYKLLGNPDTTPDIKAEVRQILAALGQDVDEVESGAKAIARAFESPETTARRANEAQHRAMGMRR